MVLSVGFSSNAPVAHSGVQTCLFSEDNKIHKLSLTSIFNIYKTRQRLFSMFTLHTDVAQIQIFVFQKRLDVTWLDVVHHHQLQLMGTCYLLQVFTHEHYLVTTCYLWLWEVKWRCWFTLVPATDRRRQRRRLWVQTLFTYAQTKSQHVCSVLQWEVS